MTDPNTTTDTSPDGLLISGPWLPSEDPEDGSALLAEPAATSGVVDRRPAQRALTGRVIGRWRSGGDGGRVYAIGRPRPRRDGDDDPAAAPGAGATRAVLRVLYRIARGHLVLARRALDAATHGVIREQIRLARATGDAVALAAWVDRLRDAKQARHDRLRGAPQLVASVTVLAAGGAGVVGVVLLGGGLAVAVTHPAGWTWGGWWSFWGLLAHWATVGVVVVVQVVAWGTVPAWLVAASRAGRRGEELPRWLAPALTGAREDVPITPSLVVTALRDLGLSRLTKAIKAMPDHGAGMLSLITTAGCGVELDIALPSGTSTKDVQERQDRFAENLSRHEHEVHLLIPKAARTIRVWIADSGALDEPIGPSPLVYDDDVEADYYNSRAPWGEDLRGDAVGLLLKQCHILVTGLSNQGKTAALRALLLWLAFDRSVEFWLGDLKGIGDWGMFRGLAKVLIEGPTDEHVVAVTYMVEAGVAEMNRRTLAVGEMATAKGVIREMARAGSGLHPLVITVDEAQVAFMCPKVGEDGRPYGGRTARSRFYQAVRQIQNQGRAVNVTINLGTQDPTNDNLPKIIREAFHIRASLFVGTESQARMSVGEAAVDGGAAPHRLRRGLDRGTVVISGDGVPLPRGAASMTVRTHYIDGDEATEIAKRAKDRRAPVVTADGADVGGARDELDDIDTAMRGEARVRTLVVLARLIELDPGHYRDWDTSRLRAVLTRWGTDTHKSGEMYVLADRVALAITRRDEGWERDE